MSSFPNSKIDARFFCRGDVLDWSPPYAPRRIIQGQSFRRLLSLWRGGNPLGLRNYRANSHDNKPAQFLRPACPSGCLVNSRPRLLRRMDVSHWNLTGYVRRVGTPLERREKNKSAARGAKRVSPHNSRPALIDGSAIQNIWF